MITKIAPVNGPRRNCYYPFDYTCPAEDRMTRSQQRQLISLINQNIEDEDSREDWLAQVNNEDLSSSEASSLISDFETSNW
jgi:hypothetical protein